MEFEEKLEFQKVQETPLVMVETEEDLKSLLADLTDEQKKAPLTVSLSGVVSKGIYLFRVAAINSAGQGEWSTPFTTTMP